LLRADQNDGENHVMGLSPAGQALGALGMGGLGGAGALLRQQAGEESDETKRKRQQNQKLAGLSPAGIALSNMGIFGL
jgi:hypothetical protein